MAHVPSADTRSFQDIDFDRALSAALLPAADYDAEKWLFVPNTYTEYRYLLGTRGENPLICVGVNPSTARPDHLDPTLQSVQRIALNNGYDSFIMMNVYAQRATSPADMDRRFHEALHLENMKAFRYALSLSREKAVWAAWGNIVETRPYLLACVRDMARISLEENAAWYHCGPVSKKGHPHHPLYLPASAKLEPFDTEGYLSI